MSRHAPPAGYVRFLRPGTEVVALAAHADAVRRAMAVGSLYQFAARHPGRRELRGRVAAYAVPLPGGDTRVVVRHSHHGGMLARLSGDRFLPPTRAPQELLTSLRLRDAEVPTPELIAYAIHADGPLFRRSDVATREVMGARDLGAALLERPSPEERATMLDAVASLLRALTRAGARHPDLNVKNVLLAPAPGAERFVAHVLDVDRVVFGLAGDARIAEANVRRLAASARKWRALHGVGLLEEELAVLADSARSAA